MRHVESLQLLTTPFCKDTPQPLCVQAWINVGWHDLCDPGAYPDYVTTSSHATTLGNVLAQQVHILDFFRDQVLTNCGNNRKLSGGFLPASMLRAAVDRKKLWDGVIENYKFSNST